MNQQVQKLVGAACAGLLIFSTACKKPDSGGTAGGSGEIVVGEFASLTGKEATFGQSSHKGTQLAVEEINKGGGVLGRQIKLVTEDTQSKPGESSTGVRKMISRDKAVAILGEVASSRSLEGADVCMQNKIPMISPSSTNPKVTQKGEYIFRVCFTDEFQGGVLAKYGSENLKLKRVAILTDAASAYSDGLTKYFKDHYAKTGGEVVIEVKYSGGDKDFNSQLTAIKAANPDGIFVPGYYTDVGLIVSQARGLGITVPLWGGDGWEAPELIEIGGKAMEGTYYTTHFSPESTAPEAQAFVTKFKARFNEVPDAMAALGYDSALVLADAMKRAGTTDEPKLRDAIAATKDFVGATGKTTIDANRDATKPAVIITVENGKFKYLSSVNP